MFNLFKKQSVKDLLIKSMKRQRRTDEIEFASEKERIETEHQRSMNLMKSAYEAELYLKDEEIDNWKSREKELSNREYQCKTQIITNYNIAQQITRKTTAAGLTFEKEIG